MREDQARKLNDLTERLADVVIKEADPWQWPAADVAINEQTKQERGDRYWYKKNATASLTLLTKLVALGVDWRTRKPGTLEDDAAEDLDEEIRQAEREAAKMLEKTLSTVKRNHEREGKH